MIPYFSVTVDRPEQATPEGYRRLWIRGRKGRLQMVVQPDETIESLGEKIVAGLQELQAQEETTALHDGWSEVWE